MLKVSTTDKGTVRFSLNFDKNDSMKVVGYRVEYYPKDKKSIIRDFDISAYDTAKVFFEIGCKEIEG